MLFILPGNARSRAARLAKAMDAPETVRRGSTLARCDLLSGKRHKKAAGLHIDMRTGGLFFDILFFAGIQIQAVGTFLQFQSHFHSSIADFSRGLKAQFVIDMPGVAIFWRAE